MSFFQGIINHFIDYFLELQYDLFLNSFRKIAAKLIDEMFIFIREMEFNLRNYSIRHLSCMDDILLR
uniref:Uncharacterized protein n=1 Tax=Onchocerca volvulus TaxID=6282 RepID=A0A8R1XMD6_ONCVO